MTGREDLEIVSDDGTRYFVNPEKDVCLYKIPYRPDGEGKEFYMHKTKSHGNRYYKLHFRGGSAKFDGVNKEHIEQALKDEEPEHDTRNYTRAARIGRKTRNKISISLLNWIIKILGMS